MTRRLSHPREIESAYDEAEGLVWIRFRDTGHEFIRDDDWLAAQVMQAIQDPAAATELSAAQLKSIVGEQRWREAEAVVAAIPAAIAAAQDTSS